MRHVGQELGLVARGQRQLRRLLLERLAGELDLGVLALDLDVLVGEQARLGGELLVGLLQLALLRLQLASELLRLLQQLLGAHRRLDGVEHDADAVGELLEEGELRGGEIVERGELDDRLHLALVQHRQHDDAARSRGRPARRAPRSSAVEIGDQQAPAVGGRLADEPLADSEEPRIAASRARRRRSSPAP